VLTQFVPTRFFDTEKTWSVLLSFSHVGARSARGLLIPVLFEELAR